MGRTFKSLERFDDEYDDYGRELKAKAKKRAVKKYVEQSEQRDAHGKLEKPRSNIYIGDDD